MAMSIWKSNVGCTVSRKQAYWQTNSLKNASRKHGYQEVAHTPGLFKHDTHPICFTLVVDDFGIKYVGKEHLDHLLRILKGYYKIEVDWQGELYCRIQLDWHYNERYVDISMQTYVSKQLVQYNHKPSTRHQACPYKPAPIKYEKNSNLITPEEESPSLNAADKNLSSKW